MRTRAGLLALAVCLGAPGELAAQSNGDADEAARAAALSLLAPGLGQHEQGRARKWIFAAVEVAGWAVYLNRRGAGASARDDYRDFAWERGRIQTAFRVDGDFGYYETLSHWGRSGAFDRSDLLPGVQPEVDAGTYNGMIWERAVGIFGGGQAGEPGYQEALAYYQEHAYGTELLWDWLDDDEARGELGSLIRTSDQRFREATTALGVVIANHFVAAVEAYLWGRSTRPPASLRVTPHPHAASSGLGVMLTVPVAR